MARPLTSKQRGILGGLYSKAYKRAVQHHATDDLDEKEWRHAQCMRMAGVTISEAGQMHYLLLRMYGENLSGNSGKAFDTAMQMPEAKRRELIALVEQALTKWGFWDGYADKIAMSKFGHQQWRAITVPFHLEQMLYTINNRGQAKKEHAEGRFDGSNRNKKQRIIQRQPKPEFAEDRVSPASMYLDQSAREDTTTNRHE